MENKDLKLFMYIQNEYKAIEGDTKITYVGEAIGLHVYAKAVVGNAKLTKHADAPSKQPVEPRIIRLGGIEIKIPRREKNIKEGIMWSVKANGSHEYFVSDDWKGGLKTFHDDFDHNLDYFKDLIKNAANLGVHLDKELLKQVFSPIEERILEMYDLMKKFHDKDEQEFINRTGHGRF